MVSGKYYSLVNLVNIFLLGLFFHKHITISAEENCLNPTFKKDERLVATIFLNAEVSEKLISPYLCPIIEASKGQFSIEFRMCSGPIDNVRCKQNLLCTKNRKYACYYKHYQKLYDTCKKLLPGLNMIICDCMCAGAADDILYANEALRLKLGIKTFPSLALNGKYDPCFTDYSEKGIKNYICNAYKDELQLCKGGN